MGVCSMQRKDSVKLYTVSKVLEDLKDIKDLNKAAKELNGSTQEVFEYILNNQKIRQRITLKEYEFYSQKTEDLKTLKVQLEHFYNNYYRVVLTNTKFDELCFYNNLTLKFVLEIYLAMNTIRQNLAVWWNDKYFYSREKLIQNQFGIFSQHVEEQGQITPILCFFKLMGKISIKLLEQEGIIYEEKLVQIQIQTKGSSLYEQLMREISL